MTIERLLAQGNLQQAFLAAQKLLQQSEQASPEAYTGADFDLAMANLILGQVLNRRGTAAEALPYLQQAQQRFEVFGELGVNMASVSLAEQGRCLLTLGQLEQAVEACQENIKRADKLDDTRQVAIGIAQLATVMIRQKDYKAAMLASHKALAIFQQLDEPDTIANIYHQIGIVYRQQAQYEQAESAYRKSLSIQTRQANPVGEALTLGELANLYKAWNRLETAVDYYWQAADIYTQLGDKRYEGIARTDLANTLIKLNHLKEARLELLRAIECKKSFGHAAEPWKTWEILYNLEQADGNQQAAYNQRQKAILAYYSYRRDGGENYSKTGRLVVDVLQAIQQGEIADIEQTIKQYLEKEYSQELKIFLQKLQSILTGDRNPILAEDDEMHYDGVAELKLLLEQLQ